MLEFDYLVLPAGASIASGFHTNLPIIPLKVYSEEANTYLSYGGIVDSGAEYCMFDAQIGEAMGLVIEEGQEVTLKGPDGSAFKAYLHDVVYQVGDHQRSASIAFTYNMAPGTGILGREGFFNFFIVEIDHRNKKVRIRPYE